MSLATTEITFTLNIHARKNKLSSLMQSLPEPWKVLYIMVWTILIYLDLGFILYKLIYLIWNNEFCTKQPIIYNKIKLSYDISYALSETIL